MRRLSFTLIEVLAAVAIAALILVTTHGVITSTLSSRKRTEEVLGVYKEGSAILALVCEDLRGALYRPEVDNFGVNLETEPSGFSFVSLAWNPRSGEISPGEVGYALERDGGHLSLFRRFALIEGDLKEGGTHMLVSDSIASWKVEYFGKEGWVQEWESGESLPLAVVVEFTLEDANKKQVRFCRQAALPASDLVEPITILGGSGT